MLIDRRVVFMFAAPDISILANWFYIYYLAKIQFFFRFIIYEDAGHPGRAPGRGRAGPLG